MTVLEAVTDDALARLRAEMNRRAAVRARIRFWIALALFGTSIAIIAALAINHPF